MSNEDFLKEDYQTPDFVAKCLGVKYSYDSNVSRRFWVNEKGNITPWHYDGMSIYVFNVQVKGVKEWSLISPQTPLTCYPFSIHAVPFNIVKPDSQTLHFKTTTEPGDMLFLPPLWFHRVVTVEDSINFNWIGTKRNSPIQTIGSVREKEILKMAKISESMKLGVLAKGISYLGDLPQWSSYFEEYDGKEGQIINDICGDTSAVSALKRVILELAKIVYFVPILKTGLDPVFARSFPKERKPFPA